MKLDVTGQALIGSATLDDVAAAIAKRPRVEDWCLNLFSGHIDLDAESLGDGSLCLMIDTQDKILGATVPMDDALLQAICASLFAGDGNWRSLCDWKEEQFRNAAAPSGLGFPPAAVAGIGVMVLVLILFVFPRSRASSSSPS